MAEKREQAIRSRRRSTSEMSRVQSREPACVPSHGLPVAMGGRARAMWISDLAVVRRTARPVSNANTCSKPLRPITSGQCIIRLRARRWWGWRSEIRDRHSHKPRGRRHSAARRWLVGGCGDAGCSRRRLHPEHDLQLFRDQLRSADGVHAALPRTAAIRLRSLARKLSRARGPRSAGNPRYRRHHISSRCCCHRA